MKIISRFHVCTRILALLISVSLLAGFLCSCHVDHSDDSTAAPQTTTAPETTAVPETTDAPETTVPPTTEPAANTLPVNEAIPQLDCPDDGSRLLYALCSNSNFYLIQDSILADCASTQDDTFRLNVDSVLSDGRIVWVLFSLEHLGGEDLSGFTSVECEFDISISEDAPVTHQYYGLQSYGTLYGIADEYDAALDTLDLKSDTSRLYCFAAFHSTSGPLDSITMHLTSLFDAENPEECMDADLTIEIPIEPLPVAAGTDPNGKFELVELSPLGLWIQINETGDGPYECAFYDIALKFKDGTTFQISAEELADPDSAPYGWFGQHHLLFGTQTCLKVHFGDPLLDPSAVEAIVIDGTEIPLSVS